MAFNLKKVLRALVFSTSQPLSVKDLQAAFTRYHEQAAMPVVDAEETGVPEVTPEGSAPSEALKAAAAAMGQSADAESEAVNPLALLESDPELYQDVPSLVPGSQIRETMAELQAEIRAADLGLELIEGKTGYQLVTEGRFARWIRVLRNEPPPVKLSQSALETLSVIAYRQPVTRTEIEHIRGVSAEAGVNKLLERELIYIVGRADLPGRPLQFGTTDKFLEFVGVRSLDELPASDVLSNRQIDDWLQKTTNAKPPSDEEMGLPLELGEGSSPSPTLEPVTLEHGHAAAPSIQVSDTDAADAGGANTSPSP